MHVYQPKIFSKEQDQILRKIADNSGMVENFLSDKEFQLCRQLFKAKIKWPEHGQVSKYWGFDWATGPGPLLKWLKPKIEGMFSDVDFDFLALQEAINPWKIHADIRWHDKKIPHKVILLPLDVELNSGPADYNFWPQTYTITFNQRNFLTNFNENAIAAVGNDQSEWGRPVEDKGVENLVTGTTISKNQWEDYFSHMPYEFLEGLTIDSIFKWQPKSLLYWDNTALHCADNFLKNNILTKRSLLIFTTYKNI